MLRVTALPPTPTSVGEKPAGYDLLIAKSGDDGLFVVNQTTITHEILGNLVVLLTLGCIIW